MVSSSNHIATGGDATAWKSIGIWKGENLPGPCWGSVNMVGSSTSLFPMVSSLRMKALKGRGEFLTLTVSGQSSLGASCLMDVGLQLWVGITMPYNVAFVHTLYPLYSRHIRILL